MLTAVRDALTRATGPLSSARNMSEAIMAARVAASDIERSLRLAIAESRADARMISATGFKAQLDEVSKALGLSIPKPMRATRPIDDVAAHTAASSYGTAWLGDATARLSIANRTGQPNASRAAEEATKAQSHRVERIATTEVATAFNDEQRELATEAAAGSPVWSSVTFRRWDARLDAKVCSVCAEHDGEEVPLDASFKGDAEPGAVHPRCRCVATIVTFPDRLAIVERQEARRREWVNPKTGKPMRAP